MMGFGFSEMVLVAVVLIMAVGPKHMPTLVRSLGRAMREFRKASRDLRSTIGVDEIMRDDELQQLRQLGKLGQDPLGLKSLGNQSPAASPTGAPDRPMTPLNKNMLSTRDRERELPPEGVDVAYAGYLGKLEILEAQARDPNVAEKKEEPALPTGLFRSSENENG